MTKFCNSDVLKLAFTVMAGCSVQYCFANMQIAVALVASEFVRQFTPVYQAD